MMSNNSYEGILKHVQKLSRLQALTNLKDSELLERFLSLQDEMAFTVLIERHGPMVHAVCCRTLGNTHDAEDACQATFLVLARKAQTIQKKRSLSSWLHGVALRLASNLKRKLARRQRREQDFTKSESYLPHSDVSWREVQSILDDELQSLPERYRSALILCYLEEKTRDEAAEQLHISKGSLHGLLQRGRNLLRERLQRRGISLPSALIVTALSQGVCQGGLPPTMIVSSTKAAMAFTSFSTSEPGVIAPHILSLSQEVLKGMFITKLRSTAQVLLGVLMLATLIGSTLVSSIQADPIQKALAASKEKIDRTESDREFIHRLSKDLRGHAPTATEVHFFIHSNDPNRRKLLIDFFVQERQAKKLQSAKEADMVKANIAKGLKYLQEAQRREQHAQEWAARAKLLEAQANELKYVNEVLKKRLSELATQIEKKKKSASTDRELKDLDNLKSAYDRLQRDLAISELSVEEANATAKRAAKSDAKKTVLRMQSLTDLAKLAKMHDDQLKSLQEEMAVKNAQLRKLRHDLEKALKKK